MLPVPVDQVEIVEGQPADGALERSGRPVAGRLPAVQAAAAAAGGFMAGAAVVGLVHRRHSRSRALGRRRASGALGRRRGTAKGAGPGERLQIVGSRSLLLDIHLLGGSGAGR